MAPLCGMDILADEGERKQGTGLLCGMDRLTSLEHEYMYYLSVSTCLHVYLHVYIYTYRCIYTVVSTPLVTTVHVYIQVYIHSSQHSTHYHSTCIHSDVKELSDMYMNMCA